MAHHDALDLERAIMWSTVERAVGHWLSGPVDLVPKERWSVGIANYVADALQLGQYRRVAQERARIVAELGECFTSSPINPAHSEFDAGIARAIGVVLNSESDLSPEWLDDQVSDVYDAIKAMGSGRDGPARFTIEQADQLIAQIQERTWTAEQRAEVQAKWADQ